MTMLQCSMSCAIVTAAADAHSIGAHGRRSGDDRPATKAGGVTRGTIVNEPIYQIPNEVRDFAEKSVEQARKAFEGFAGAAQKAIGSVETTTSTFQTGAKDVTVKAFGYAEANVNAAFDLASKLLRAKDPQEVLQLQAEYVKSQVESIQTQAKELGAALQKATTGK
jgi:phasin